MPLAEKAREAKTFAALPALKPALANSRRSTIGAAVRRSTTTNETAQRVPSASAGATAGDVETRRGAAAGLVRLDYEAWDEAEHRHADRRVGEEDRRPAKGAEQQTADDRPAGLADCGARLPPADQRPAPVGRPDLD